MSLENQVLIFKSDTFVTYYIGLPDNCLIDEKAQKVYDGNKKVIEGKTLVNPKDSDIPKEAIIRFNFTPFVVKVAGGNPNDQKLKMNVERLFREYLEAPWEREDIKQQYYVN